jgi:hypothetical protein
MFKEKTDVADIIEKVNNNNRFEPSVACVLRNAGWYEGRKIDISEKVKRLEALGYEVFDQAKLFLQEFDDLRLPQTSPYYSERYDYKGEREYIYNNFNVSWFIDVLEKISPENRKRKLERSFSAPRAKEKTIPIGDLSDGHMFLFITESGRIVTDITIEGNTIEEGVANIIKNLCIGNFLSH